MTYDLYDGTPPHADGDTSYAAAVEIEEHVYSLRRRILKEMLGAGAGLTCDEIEVLLRMRHQTASARIRELVLLNKLQDSGHRRETRSGRQARVYVGTDRLLQMVKTTAVDTETHLIKPGCITPRLVCVTTYDGTGEPQIYDREAGLDVFEDYLKTGEDITGHNFFFDLGVAVVERPRLLPLIFQRIDEGKIHCTLIREKMIANVKGELKFSEDELGELRPTGFQLSDLAFRRLGIKMKGKGSDAWRMRYNELDGVPFSEWPEDARIYAMDDAGITQVIHEHQAEEAGVIPGEIGQMQAGWSLYLMSMWGIRTDPAAVAIFEHEVVTEFARLEEVCMAAGYVRQAKNGKRSRNMAKIKDAIVAWCNANGVKVPLTKKKHGKGGGNIRTNRDTLARVGGKGSPLESVAELGRIGKLKGTYLPILKSGTVVPINAAYQPMVETFRTSCRAPNCFDEETEVLTEQGWVRFDQLDPEVPRCVAQWDNGIISFVPWLEYFCLDNNEPLIHLTNQHIDLCVTPEHRCLVQSRKTRRFEVFEAQAYPEYYYQLHSGKYEGPGTLSLSRDEMVLVCATQADGSWSKSGIRFGFSKKRKIDRLVAALDRMAVPYSRKVRMEASKAVTRIRVLAGPVVQRVRDLLGEKKTFGSWLLLLGREPLGWFCEEVWHWDGTVKTKSRYSSNSKVNSDWVQIALVLSEQRANQGVDTTQRGNRKRNYHIYATPRNYSLTNTQRSSVSRSKVYCVSVPSSYLLVRRNGKTAVTGNCQNPPREGGFRACFVPRPNHVYVFSDYSTLEMRSLAQVCLDAFGFSALADALNEGKDPHTIFAAYLLGIEYEEALARLEAGDDETTQTRAASKVANFGFGGGMGAEAFVDFAWSSYHVLVSIEKAQELHGAFRRLWPEMEKYFAYCSSLMGVNGEAEYIEFPRSGLVRGKVRYTAVCNGFFQNLAAMGAKASLYEVTKECFLDRSSPLFGCHPVFFLHDEIGMEVPYDDPERASRAADRLSEIMREVMSRWIPDIQILAEPVMSRRWYKGAKPVRVDGVLVPTKPIHAAGKTKWVIDA